MAYNYSLEIKYETPYLISPIFKGDFLTNENKSKCCEVKDDSKEKKGILKKLWCFFFGCNCH